MKSKIEFSDEQAMLLEAAMDFCQKESPLASVRKQFLVEHRFNNKQWQSMSELGWLSITVPEEFGGLGLSLSSVVPIMESMGRQLLASPFLATTLATQALLSSASAEQKQKYLPKIASGLIASLALQEESGDWNLQSLTCVAELVNQQLTLSGKKCFVLDAANAEVIIVSVLLNGKARLVLLEKSQIDAQRIQKEEVIDETRACYALDITGIKISEAQLLPLADFKTIEQAALLLLCAEMAGGLGATLNTIVDYLSNRKQFGKLIGSYQALKHPTVEILMDYERGRSLTYRAATLFDQEADDERETFLRMAKAQLSEAFSHAGDRAVQFHGGFGFTYDCDAQLFLRRALWCQHQFGDERYQRTLLAPLLLDSGIETSEPSGAML